MQWRQLRHELYDAWLATLWDSLHACCGWGNFLFCGWGNFLLLYTITQMRLTRRTWPITLFQSVDEWAVRRTGSAWLIDWALSEADIVMSDLV